MKKSKCGKLFLFVAVLAVICVAAVAAVAQENINLADIGASFTIPDGYIVLTRTNLEEHQEWLSNHGYTTESLLAEWAGKGTLVQAWLPNSDDVCISVNAVQDDFSRKYFDLDQQTPTERAAFRQAHRNGTDGYSDGGYTYSYAEWKNTDQYGRFLQLEYKQKASDATYRGIARRAVRNGYTITLDYRVRERRTNNDDQKVVNRIMSTWHFTVAAPLQSLSLSADGTQETLVSPITVLSYPEEETNTGKIKVSGVCSPNMKVLATFMCMSSADPVNQEAVCDKNGKFAFSQSLPKEGVWLTTLTAMNGDEIVSEEVLNTTTYRKMLLPVNFTTPETVKMYESVPAGAEAQTLTADSTVVSGTTISGVSIQFFVNGELQKEDRTNDTGKFSFKFDSSKDGNYEITMVFSKKNLSTRRFKSTAVRILTEDDIRRQAKGEAIKPAYSVLTSKLDRYNGRIMTYSLYVSEVNNSGENFVYTMAMSRTKAGAYKDKVVVTATGDQGFGVGEKHSVYLKCSGEYEIQSDEGTEKLPCFELLFADD